VESKYVEMVCRLSEQSVVEAAPLVGLQVRHLSQIDDGDLYPCYYAAFQAGDAQFFFEQGEKERREYFDTLGLETALKESASVALVQGRRLVGFVYVLPYGEGNCHISCMCVHPDWQRRGLGKLLLRLAMDKAAQDGYRTMSLGTSISMGAFQLYRQHGFEIKEKP
jgi:ribosomal protein S18 acetylase RimI-like enzyme